MLHFLYRLGNQYIFVCLHIKYLSIAGLNLEKNRNLEEILDEIRFWMDEK